MEFACKLAGSKLLVVLGHTKCGAIKGACEGVQLGNLTTLLNLIQPSVYLEGGRRAGGRTAAEHRVRQSGYTHTHVRRSVEGIDRAEHGSARADQAGRGGSHRAVPTWRRPPWVFLEDTFMLRRGQALLSGRGRRAALGAGAAQSAGVLHEADSRARP